MRSDRERLLDILEAIDSIERYTIQGRSEFDRSELIQTWVVHHLQIIGEAAAKLSSAFRNEHPEIPWTAIIAMRNILIHDYFGIDTEEVWATVERDLPDLKSKVKAILETLPRD
ncbi:MAG: DUF86 domain-containing protein [candidate division WOR-3 bacterium]